jgi:integrase
MHGTTFAAYCVALMEPVDIGEPEVHRQRGKWVVRVTGYDPATGRRRVRQLGTFDTRRAALAVQKAAADGRAGGKVDTLAGFLESVWLPAKEGRVEPSTYAQYQWAVTRHIVPLLGAVRLRDLGPEVVDAWLRAIAVAPEPNPVPLTQAPRRARPAQQLGWTIDEARTFLAATATHRLYAAFHLALVTGLRRGEVLALRWSDVDLDRCQLEVRQQLAVELGRPILKQLKTEASERVVTFGAATTKALARHRDQQDRDAEFVGDAWQESGLVFTTALGGWVDPNNFGRLMDELIVRAGVPRITPKGLRHTAQSVGRVVVGDDKVMQERLGHADVEITLNTYTHTVSAQHREAGDRLDAVFQPVSSRHS